MMDSLQDRLQHWMKVRDIKSKPLSKKAGLHETYVRDVLDRTANPGLDKIAKLCAALDIYPHDLVPEITELYPPEALKLLNRLTQIREEQRSLKKDLEALKE